MSTRAKIILSYIAGIVTAVVAFFVFALFYANSNAVTSSEDEQGYENKDLVIFDEPQQEIKVDKLKIFQVLPDGSALASVKDYMDNYGLVVLFAPVQDISFYDGMIIEVNSGECLMHIGTYRYITNSDREKTVPVVRLMNRE